MIEVNVIEGVFDMFLILLLGLGVIGLMLYAFNLEFLKDRLYEKINKLKAELKLQLTVNSKLEKQHQKEVQKLKEYISELELQHHKDLEALHEIIHPKPLVKGKGNKGKCDDAQ